MEISTVLRNKIIDHLETISYLNEEKSRQSLVDRAGLDKNLKIQIYYTGTISQFCELLISALINYGQLEDGRDPIIAILEASKSFSSVTLQKKCDQLISLCKTTSPQKTKPSREISIYRQAYFQKIIEDVGTLKLSRIASSNSHPIHLSRIYIDLPTDVFLDLDVNNYQITNWRVRRDKNYPTGITFDKKNNTQYDIQSIIKIIEETQKHINGKKGNISEEEKERPLILAPLWKDGRIAPYIPLNTLDLASTINRLVLLGEPGTGKSTFAQFMALYLIKLNLNSDLEELPSTIIGHWPHGPLTPVYIELRRFVDWEKYPELHETVSADHLWEFIVEKILGPNINFKDELWDDVINGKVLFLIDGLDEAPIPPDIDNAQEMRQRQLIELAHSLSTRFPQCRIIFTSRPLVFSSLEADFEYAGFRAAKLIPLNSKQMMWLSSKLYTMFGIDSDSAKEKSEQLINSLSSVADYLKNRPLFLTLIVILSLDPLDTNMPTSEGALLRRSILLLIDRWTQGKIKTNSQQKLKPEDTEKIYQILEEIAYRVHNRTLADKYNTNDIDVGEIYRGFSVYRNRMYEIVDYLTQQAGIFEPVSPIGSQLYRFAHRTFQEFLAASYLVRKGNFLQVRELIQSNPVVWREPCILIGEILSEMPLRNIFDLLTTLSNIRIPSDGEDESIWYSVWLASSLVINQELYRKNIPYDLAKMMRDLIKTLLKQPLILSPIDRVQCGKALGFLGDNRHGIGIKDKLPEIDWCTIPDGPFPYGTTPEQVNELKNKFGEDFPIDHEISDNYTFDLPEFQISRYPITHAQFQVFINRDDGYFNTEWWPPNGLYILHNFGPSIWDVNEPPNLPQNNVSWYEAVAFCNWLSEKLHEDIHLPSEIQWEKAARGNDKRIFPWGNDFNPNLCNTHETGIGKPSPVGCFALPNNPWGEIDSPLDMCGNVWEWCISILEREGESKKTYYYPYNPNDGRENIFLGDDYLRVVRGGSFTNIPFLARTTLRGRDRPSLRVARQGFRVVKTIKKTNDI